MWLPRVRFTVRRMMVAVAIMAVILAVLVSPLTKPYPTVAGRHGAFVLWLVDSDTPHSGQKGPTLRAISEGLVFVRVERSDATATWHLRRPSWLPP
jgi:hypothetical protein